MGKVPQQRRKLKSNVGRKSGLSKKTQRNNNHKRGDMKVSETIANSIVKEAWDKNSTMKQNFVKLGLVQNPNVGLHKKKNKNRGQSIDVDTSVVPKLEAALKAHVPTARFAAGGEIRFVQELVEKHGEDYVAMARDHKLNVYQHTPKQIKRKILKVQGTLDIVRRNVDAEDDNEEEEEVDEDEDEDEDE